MRLLSGLRNLLCVGVLAGCSGGAILDTSAFETAEYNSQAGLILIKASSIYTRGGTGKNILVAVFDTGGSFTHPDLDGNYNANSYFFGPYGTANDGNGHGTHVSGIIAAEKNDTGVHGVAYEAQIVAYKILDDAGFGTALNDTTLAAAINQMTATNVMITNNSWSSGVAVTTQNAASVLAANPQTIAAYRAYQAAGGVQVWAAGNSGGTQPDLEAGLPFLFSDLQDNWIAVMAVDLNGSEPAYTDRCGVAAAWCIAAPGGSDSPTTGGVFSTQPGGGYVRLSGTSMAAPHVSGAMAALKSLFPTLTYKEVRDRLLTTATKTGVYSVSSIYGQGLLNLDAASNPVGVLSIATGDTNKGSVTTTTGSALSLSAGAAKALSGQNILLVDDYQKATFFIPLKSFVTPTPSYLSTTDVSLFQANPTWNSSEHGVTMALRSDQYQVSALSNRNYFVGFGQGPKVLQGFARMTGHQQPQNSFRMPAQTMGATLGVKTSLGMLYASTAAAYGASALETGGFGMSSWSPSSLMSLTLAPGGASGSFGVSIANDLQRPMSWTGSGSFAISGQSINLGYANSFNMGQGLNFGLAGQLAYVTADPSDLVVLGDSVVASAELNMSYDMSAKTRIRASIGREFPIMTGNSYLKAGSGITAAGVITYNNVAIAQAPSFVFDKIKINIEHQVSPRIKFGGSLSAVRDGYGDQDFIVGFGGQLTF